MYKDVLNPNFAYRDKDLPGQPWVITSAGCEQVRVWRSNGVNQADIARQLGIGPRTFRDLLERDEELKDAYEAGSGQAESELVGILMKQARDGNTTAAIFLLKGAHGFRETTPVAPKNDAAPNISITIPSTISPNDLVRLTSQMKDVSPGVGSHGESPSATVCGGKTTRIAQ